MGRKMGEEAETMRRVTSKRFLRALKGTNGNRSAIASRLGIERATVELILTTRTGSKWDRVRKAFQDECDRVLDLSEKTVAHWIGARSVKLAAVSLKAATWHLEKRNRKAYGDSKTITLEGGEKPLQYQSTSVISPEVLAAMPIEARRALLEAMEKAKGI